MNSLSQQKPFLFSAFASVFLLEMKNRFIRRIQITTCDATPECKELQLKRHCTKLTKITWSPKHDNKKEIRNSPEHTLLPHSAPGPQSYFAETLSQVLK